MILSGNPEEAGPEVSVAAGTATYIRFDASIDKASVEVEGRPMRFRWVEVGERLVAVEPSVDLGVEEKLLVRVRYKDGASPAGVTLVLASHPTRVDKEVEVVRRPRTVEALEAALAEKEAELATLRASSGLAGLVFSGRLDPDGVRARRIMSAPEGAWGGLKVAGGVGYRANSWALAVVRVRNLPGQSPWMPGVARLIHADGTALKVLSVDMNKAQLAPGEEGVVTVEPEAPYWKAGDVFRLELLDKSGARPLPTLDVAL